MLSLLTLLALRATAVLGAVDLTARREPVLGLPDWSKAGYNGGVGQLPSDDAVGKVIGPDELKSKYGITPDDGVDDSDGLERAIADLHGSGGDSTFTLVQLPAGVINLSRTVYLDASHVILRGAGNDPKNGGTVIEFRPDNLTLYDVLEPKGDRWSQEGMSTSWDYSTAEGKQVSSAASSGWLWPGRSVFRVGSKAIAPKFEEPFNLAPKNRKDIFYGSVNYHWRNDSRVKGFMAAQDMDLVGRMGSNKIYYDGQNTSWPWRAGDDVWVAAPTRLLDYEAWGVQNQSKYTNEYMYQDWFTVQSAGRDDLGAFLTLDHDLRFDVYANSGGGGSPLIDTRFTPTKIMPIEQPVAHVGIENLYITQPMPALDVNNAINNYGNLAPESAMHGVVYRYASNCWMRGVRTYMTGSHPIATEAARFLQIQDNVFDGAWNKGAGGNGYVRGSRVWDSLYFNNTLRNLRHFTFQWSSMGNVALFNDMTNDFNLHGGWEGFNLVELNKINVPYEHRSENCDKNCGGEGTNPSDEETETWAPIYWSAGDKASAWSGASGPRNVFYRNEMKKAFTQGAKEEDYAPYTSTGSDPATVWQFAWDRDTPAGSQFVHLSLDGTAPLLDWSSRERTDFAKDPALGVNARLSDACGSLFLADVSSLTGVKSDAGCGKRIEDARDGKSAATAVRAGAAWAVGLVVAVVGVLL